MANFSCWHPSNDAVELLGIHFFFLLLLFLSSSPTPFSSFSSGCLGAIASFAALGLVRLSCYVRVVVRNVRHRQTLASSSTLRTNSERSLDVNSLALALERRNTIWTLLVVQIVVVNLVPVTIVTMEELRLSNSGQKSTVRCRWKVPVGRLASKKDSVQVRLGTSRPR